MKGYWLILKADVSDQAAQAEYGKLWAPIAEKYQARLNPTAVPPMLKEARDTAQIILVEFPSYDLAKACYEDPAYQKAALAAQRAAKRELVIIEGKLV